jgi:hydroxymethylbilane synthase
MIGEASMSMSADRAVRVGTRTSRLARVQTDMFLSLVSARAQQIRCDVVGVTTAGDRDRVARIPDLGQGAFVKELEGALLGHEIDLAVHSLKDLPTQQPPGLVLAAVMPRSDPRDVLVSQGNRSLEELPPKSRVGTGSPRRAAQVLAVRPDLRIVPLRGNVDTRIEKVLKRDEVDAVVLAGAGLLRLGMDSVITEFLPPEIMMPAVGQGFIAIECREDDPLALALARSVQDPDARATADAERAFLAAVGGVCRTPVGAYATIDAKQLVVDAMIATSDGQRILRESVSSPREVSPNTVASHLRDALYGRGGDIIIAREEPLSGTAEE